MCVCVKNMKNGKGKYNMWIPMVMAFAHLIIYFSPTKMSTCLPHVGSNNYQLTKKIPFFIKGFCDKVKCINLIVVPLPIL